jgi:glycosyltransferase involved in cell wall biosynthesis
MGAEMPSSEQLCVSIVVVTYNHISFIDECLRSCVQQAQDFPSLEIIVADDGSVDGSQMKILQWSKVHPELIVPILSSANTGIAENFNRGLRAARGRYIAWLGGDDAMLPKKILNQFELLESTPESSGCYHDAEVFAWPGGKVLGLFSELYAGKAARAKYVDTKRMLDPRYQMLPSTVMVRRSAVPTAFDVRLSFHNDYLFDLETIISGGPYTRMNGVFTRYRKHEKSIGLSTKTRATMLEENLLVCAIAEARYPELSPAINRRIVYYLFLEAVRSIGDGTRTLRLCKAIWSRGAYARSLVVLLFGRRLALLANPRYRRLAIRLRTLFL